MLVFIPDRTPLDTFRYAHLKRDGFLITVLKDGVGRVVYLTRNFKELDLSFLPVHSSIMTQLPLNTQLQCELWTSGKQASYTSSGIANKDFTMDLEVHGISASQYVSSTDSLCEAHRFMRRFNIPFVPYFDRLSSPLSCGSWENLDTFNNVAWLAANNCEGIVLKNEQYSDMYKWKPMRSCDLRIVGATPGRGKYVGTVGALTCADGLGNIVANVSGMTDAQRHSMHQLHCDNKLVGLIVEVKYQYVGSQGRLRHPVFLRFREDKDVADERID